MCQKYLLFGQSDFETIFNIVPVVFQCVNLASMDRTVPLNAALDVIKSVTIKMGHALPVTQAGQEANVKVSIKMSRYPLKLRGMLLNIKVSINMSRYPLKSQGIH